MCESAVTGVLALMVDMQADNFRSGEATTLACKPEGYNGGEWFYPNKA